MNSGFTNLKNAIIEGKISLMDIGQVINQIFNVTAYLH